MQWQPHEIEQLKQWYNRPESDVKGGLNLEEMASILGRTKDAVARKASQLRFTFPNSWTKREEEMLTEWYTKGWQDTRWRLDIKKLAKHLGKTRKAIQCKAAKLGLSRRRVRLEDVKDKLIKISKQDLSHEEMAAKLGIAKNSVRNFLIQLGLPTNREYANSPNMQKNRRRGMLRWLHEQGYDSIRDFSLHRMLDESSKRWSSARTPSQCNVLDILEKGPYTIDEISNQLKLSPGRVKVILSELKELGCIKYKWRRLPGTIGGCLPKLWLLATTRTTPLNLA